jgi:autotransporter passenger strand-loop-strand repeat protein
MTKPIVRPPRMMSALMPQPGDDPGVHAGGAAIDLGAASGARFTQAGDPHATGRVTSTGVFLYSGSTLIANGATLSNETVSTGETEYVLSGLAISTTVVGGGTQTVSSGGVASATTLLSGGLATVFAAGVISDAIVGNQGTVYVNSGGVAAGGTIDSGGEESGRGQVIGVIVASGGELDAAVTSEVVVSGGVQNAGVASGTTIDSGGLQRLSYSAHTVGTIVGFGGSQGAAFGATATGTTIDSGGHATFYSAYASALTIGSGGYAVLSRGAVARATLVSSGGTLIALPGGTASGTTIAPGGAVVSTGLVRLTSGMLISAGSATAQDDLIGAGGIEYVLAGGTELDATVSNGGGIVVFSGGVASGADVTGPGPKNALAENVSSGGADIAATVGSGATQDILPGGTALSSFISDGGYQWVSGTASAVVIGSGGVQSVGALEHRASATDTTIQSGGRQTVFGGIVSATVIESGGVQTNEGTSYATMVLSGGFVDVTANYLGGTSIDTVVQSTGVVDVGAQAFTSGTVLESGALEAVQAAGTANGTIISAGGVQTVAYGYGSGHNEVGGGFAEGTIILSGGYQAVSSFAANAQVFAGGSQLVVGLYHATEGTILSGGQEHASFFATASATTIDANGTLFLYSAFAQDSMINSGGQEYVGTDGTASSSVISAGGLQFVQAGDYGFHDEGGRASGTTILSGGEQYLQAAPDHSIEGDVTDTLIEAGGTLDVAYQAFVSGLVAQFDAATDVLVLSGGGTQTGLQLSGDYTGDYFALSNDGAGGTDVVVVEGTPCYCRGTNILTPTGEIPVEDLRIGDHLITRSGEPRVLRWIGRRSYAGRFAANNRDVLPVLFRAGSLGERLPHRDLYVSPLHAMYIDGVLIPAACLVNNDTILHVASIDQVDYFHLELDTHDVIIAEGAPAETYIDDDNRGMFHNAAEHAARYPDAKRAAPAYCAPRVEDGDALHAIRRRLHGAPPPAPTPLRGGLDLVERHRIAGWAMADDTTPVRLRLLDNGVVLCEFTADLPRPDVRAAVGGDGRCGFNHIIEGGLAPDIAHLIQVQRAADARELSRSPWLLEAQPCTAQADPSPLRGCLDQADRIAVQGWAQAGTEPVDLQILDNGILVGRVLANRFRADLADANHADGRCAFAYRFPAPLSPAIRHAIEVRRATDGTKLANSPLLIDSANAFDTDLQTAVAHAVAAIPDHDRARVLSFLLTQTDRLKQRTADAHAHRTERDDFWQFRRRWGANPATSSPPLRALVIDRDLPTPDRDAGSQAILSHMQALQRLGYQVSFVAAEQMAHTNTHLTNADITHCAAPLYASVEEVLRRQSGCFDLVYLHRAGIAEAYLALSRRWMPKARIVYAVADLHHLRLARQAEIEQRPELHAQSRRLRLAEWSAAWHADAVLTHSPHEAALLRKAVPHARVHVVPWHVPLRPTRTAFAKRRGLAFIANYAHDPNVDAARVLVEDIMPLVWAQDPTIDCRLAGSAMPATIRALATPKVRLLGHIADLATLFNQVRLTVAPLRYGAGIKGKVLSSLAAGIPCAATPIAAEGLELPPDLIAASPAHLAALIVRLHRNQTANRTASRAGQALIAAAHAADQVDAALAQALASATRLVA